MATARRILLSGLASLILTGCATLAPPYAPPPTPVPKSYAGAGEWTPASPADTRSHGPWWRIYDDPTLSRLERRLRAGNPSLAAMLDRYDEALALTAEARAGTLPQIGVAGVAKHVRQSDNRPLRGKGQPDAYNDDVFAGELSYEIDLWGRIRSEVTAAKAEARAERADLASARLSLEARLAEAYFHLRGLDAEEHLLAVTTTDYARALRITEDRHRLGIDSGLDVARARTQYESAYAAKTDAIARRAVYQDEIATLIGVPAPSFSLPSLATVPMPPRVPLSAPSTLLQRRPDIAAAERRVAAANAEIGVTRAAFFPSIDLSAAGGFEDAGGGIGLFSLPNLMWSAGSSLMATVFDGGRRRAADRAAFDRLGQASADYRQTVLKAFQQVEDNLVLCNDLAREATRQSAAVHAAEHAAKLSLILYRGGAVSYLDVAVARTGELDARRAALTLATRRLLATVDLIRALGGGWTRSTPGHFARRNPP